MRIDEIACKNLNYLRRGVALVFIFSVCQYVYYYQVYFSETGIFTNYLASHFYQNLKFILPTASILIHLLALGSGIALFFGQRTAVSALVCLTCHIFFSIRNPYLLHLGDKYIFYLLIILIFLPWATIKMNKEGSLKGLLIFAIKAQFLIIYGSNLFLKIQNGWLNDAGLESALLETELQTDVARFILNHHTLLNSLNIMAIFAAATVITLSFFPKYFKYFLILHLGYHLSSLAMLKLDWLPIVACLPGLLFLPQPASVSIRVGRLYNRIYPVFLLVSLILSCMSIGSKDNRISRWTQSWSAYSPPSAFGGTFSTFVRQKNLDKMKVYLNAESIGSSDTFSNLRHYKLFHYMAKVESEDLRLSYFKFLCSNSEVDMVGLSYLMIETTGKHQITNRILGQAKCE